MDNQNIQTDSAAKAGSGNTARAGRARRTSLASEFLAYLMQNKKWWMIPIIVMMLLLALALILTASPAAPFMYSLW